MRKGDYCWGSGNKHDFWEGQIVARERGAKKAYASPSLKKWGSIKDLTMNGKAGKGADNGLGGSFPGDV
jgi:hypothetical protein